MTTKKMLAAILGAVLLAGCCSVCNGPKDSPTTFAKDALMPYVENGQLPGAISVFYKDGVQEVACVGYADVAAKRKITMDDVYMQCSQTKGFCGVTIAKLVEEGKITLDDPVSKYLPEFKTLWIDAGEKDGVKTLRRAKNVLTVRMVLNHTGGFPFEICAKQPGIRGGGWSGGAPLRQTAAIAAACPLLFEPGTKVQYSNTGIDIGAAVVEVVTGMRWEDYLQQNVLDPLGMTNTTFWPTEDQLAHLVESYTCQSNAPAAYLYEHGWEQRPYNDRSRIFASAGAGLWTTANDQLKFYKMLMNLGLGENGARILKEETVKSLLAVSTRPAGLGGYSLGLSAPERDGEDQWFGHGGAWGTNCMVNWHKKQLKLWAVQLAGGPRPWDNGRSAAADRFFATKIDNAGADAYTGRMK
ncbi:MAG: serine hydrolase domain-containing protein [Kiritimatiellia bacterium]